MSDDRGPDWKLMFANVERVRRKRKSLLREPKLERASPQRIASKTKTMKTKKHIDRAGASRIIGLSTLALCKVEEIDPTYPRYKFIRERRKHWLRSEIEEYADRRARGWCFRAQRFRFPKNFDPFSS